LDERRVTRPDFFVDEVRLDAAAARCVPFELLRDPPFLDEVRLADFVPPRLVERADDFVDRDEEREPDLEPPRDVDLALERDEDFVDFLALDFRAEDFVPDFFADDFVPLFRAEDFVPDFFAADLVPDFLAADLVPDFFDELREEVFVPDFLELDFEPLFAAVREPDFLELDFAPLFFAPLLRDEPLRERELFDEVEPPPDEPPELDSFIMVSDLSSVAITASLQGPSRANRHA
jgi:hypothetical protein